MNKSKYQEALDRLICNIGVTRSDYRSSGQARIDVSMLQELVDKADKLEKALDKACEKLEELSYVKGVGQVGMCYVEWKEWCMKDVE